MNKTFKESEYPPGDGCLVVMRADADELLPYKILANAVQCEVNLPVLQEAWRGEEG